VETGDKIRGRWPDWAALACYLAAAVVVLLPLWSDPNGKMLADNAQDETFFEWVLTHAARSVTHGDSPIFTDQLNAPLGVNLMANTSVLGLALPLSPVTLLFGAGVTFVLISTLALALTAAAWYYVFSRHLVRRPAAAFAGGLFCGFAPAMVSQVTGHPNIAGQFLIPFIVLTVARLREPGSPWRRGLILAGLVIYQCFLNEEMLFLTALTLLIFLLVYLPPGEWWPALRRALPAFGVAALVAGVVLAYPLWRQFAGPQSYRGLPGFVLGLSSDLASFKEFSRRSIFGGSAANLARIDMMGGPTEENTFFGIPLVLLFLAAAVALWRVRVARAAVVTAVLFALLSLGNLVKYNGTETTWTGPWKLLSDLPLFDSVVPTRLALVITPMLGILVALLLDRFEGFPAAVWASAVIAALIPLIPTPQPAADRTVPVFFTSGDWRSHVPKDGTVVPVPGGWYEYLDAMQWSTAAHLEFNLVGGYFLAPDPGRDDREAVFGPAVPPTMQLISDVAGDGTVPVVSDDQRRQARTDIAYWHATTFVLPERHANSEPLRQTLDQLLGPGQHVDDVWIWSIS